MTHSFPQGLLFDLDGTLLDTLEDLADAVNAVLQAEGLPGHALDHYRYAVGEGAENLIRRCLPETLADREQRVPGLLARFKQIYGENLVVKTRLYPGIAELLDALSARKLPLGVLSNKPDGFTRTLVQGLLGRWRFAYVAGHRADWPRKPDPASAIEAAGVMGVEPAHVLYLGDTSTDMKTAVSAGMVPVGVLWGFRGERELRDHGAKHIIAHPMDLLELVD